MVVIDNYVKMFSKNEKPCYTAESGETVQFRTLDCYSGTVKTDDDFPDELDEEESDLATGLLYVKGAEKGDVLVVDILDVEVDDQGVCCAIGGPLADTCEPRTKVIPIKDRIATFNDLKWEVDPMIGVIGVAPAGDPIACVQIGDHGGNMDSKKIKKGSRLYFPVQVEGALLGMGDIHVYMLFKHILLVWYYQIGRAQILMQASSMLQN